MTLPPEGFPYVTITRLRRHMIHDPYSGEETLGSWENATPAEIENVLFAPGTSDEFPNVELDQLSALATLYLPFGADVTAADRVLVDGALWEVTGRRADWPPHGSVVTLNLNREES